MRKRHRNKLLIGVKENELQPEEWENLVVVEPAASTEKAEVEAYEARVKEKENTISVLRKACDREHSK